MKRLILLVVCGATLGCASAPFDVIDWQLTPGTLGPTSCVVRLVGDGLVIDEAEARTCPTWLLRAIPAAP